MPLQYGYGSRVLSLYGMMCWVGKDEDSVQMVCAQSPALTP